jgi:hypothetical protein
MLLQYDGITSHARLAAHLDLGTVSNVVVSPPSSRHKTFPYESLYQSLIDQKKGDKSYRYFRSITRLQDQFPFAQCAQTRKKVDVWCSNDYVCLGHLAQVDCANVACSWPWAATLP